MLEIRRGIAVRHYENSFFREFATNLQKLFEKYNLDGLLIANSECTVDERLQIDALLITKHIVCIIDFKNFGGKIILPNEDNFFNGIWTNENGDRIKGGSSINPYKQLSIQKKKFISNHKRNIIGIYEKHIKDKLYKDDIFNPRHILRIVCFQNKVELIGNIPQRDKIDFFIVDKTNYLETFKDIIDIIDDEISISQKSFEIFKEIFKANKFDLVENYENINNELTMDISQLKIENLYQDQNIAYNEINNFLNSKDKNVFILDGSTNSGKSYMIPYIEELAYKAGFQEVKNIVQSKRIANNLTSDNIKFESMYSYIYGGNTNQNDNYGIDEKEIEQFDFKIIPLKHNDDEGHTLYIVDEAQLISDSYYKSIDLQFGSGHILKDFIEYVNVGNSKRKIIFIGDSYQLSIGSKKEVSLNNKYIEEQYKLKTAIFSLVDKPNYSMLTNEALKLTSSIRKQKFNLLKFDFSSQLNNIKKDQILEYIKRNINDNFKILVYSNSDAQKVNLWIKKSILQNGEDVTKEDLIVFNNNISLENEDDPFAQPQKVYNGEFAKVVNINNQAIISEPIIFNSKTIILKFREIEVALTNGITANILSLENFRLNSKNELSEDEIIAYQILLKQLIKEEAIKIFEKQNFLETQSDKNYFNKLKEDGRIKANNDKEKEIKEKLKNIRKEVEQKLYSDTSSKYYKYKNCAWIKFGWALTVHKAISYKFDKILINTDQGDNRGATNENYFRWLYTALTRAGHKATLINYEPITPFKNTKIVFSNINRKDFYYITSNNENLKNNELINKYNFPEEKYFLIDFYKFISSKIQNHIKILEIEHKDWQEIYHFKLDSKKTIIQFYYNGKNQFKAPKIISYEDNDFKQIIEDLLLNDIKLKNFDGIESRMKENYLDLKNILEKENIYISYIISKPYKDEIKFFNDIDNVIADFNYNGDGFFTKIELFAQEQNTLANKLKDILENL